MMAGWEASHTNKYLRRCVCHLCPTPPQPCVAWHISEGRQLVKEKEPSCRTRPRLSVPASSMCSHRRSTTPARADLPRPDPGTMLTRSRVNFLLLGPSLLTDTLPPKEAALFPAPTAPVSAVPALPPPVASMVVSPVLSGVANSVTAGPCVLGEM